jgi:hypothetical protein
MVYWPQWLPLWLAKLLWAACVLTHSCCFSAEKNLKALKIILKDLPANTRLAFVGDGPERAALQQEYADMPNVKFMVSLQLR